MPNRPQEADGGHHIDRFQPSKAMVWRDATTKRTVSPAEMSLRENAFVPNVKPWPCCPGQCRLESPMGRVPPHHSFGRLEQADQSGSSIAAHTDRAVTGPIPGIPMDRRRTSEAVAWLIRFRSNSRIRLWISARDCPPADPAPGWPDTKNT